MELIELNRKEHEINAKIEKCKAELEAAEKEKNDLIGLAWKEGFVWDWTDKIWFIRLPSKCTFCNHDIITV